MGKTLKELNFRQKCNVNIVTIIRGEQRINIPGGEERLYPFDKLVVVGADVDLEHFRQYLVERYKKAQTDKEQTTHEVNMEQFTIAEGSHLIGRTILESGHTGQVCLSGHRYRTRFLFHQKPISFNCF